MNKANYVSVAQAAAGNGCYPLSAQGLEFIQNQILLLQQALAAMVNTRCVILQNPTATKAGLVMIDGEVLPLKPCSFLASGDGVIRVVSEFKDIVADGVTYPEAREVRFAEYIGGIFKPPLPPGIYMLSDFITLKPIAATSD